MQSKRSETQSGDIRLVFTGHVDHGKSTILGRLLYDTNSLPQGKAERIQRYCRKNGRPFEFSFLLDALKDEQKQGITIDSARCFFSTPSRDYTIIDAPGHSEFIKNMITGASSADAAFLVIDAQEGIQKNSKRHGYLLSMLGIQQIAVLINKMDTVDYSQKTYKAIVDKYSTFLDKIGINPVNFIPVSGREGDNIAHSSENMAWYEGETVLEMMEAFRTPTHPENRPLRVPIQDVYSFGSRAEERHIIAGRILSGSLQPGDPITFYPSKKQGTVESLVSFPETEEPTTRPGAPIAFTLKEKLFVRRGEMVTHTEEDGKHGPQVAHRIRANIFWLGPEPMTPGREYKLKLNTARRRVTLNSILRVLDVSSLRHSEGRSQIEPHEVAECLLTVNRPLACDCSPEFPETGRFVIVSNHEIAGGGIVSEIPGQPAQRENELGTRKII